MFNTNKYQVDYVTGIGSIKKPSKGYLLTIEKEGVKLSYPLSGSALLSWDNVSKLSKPVFFKWEDILKIDSESQGEISKSLSMGKAAAGLLLLGPIGALLGAGMRSTHDNRVMFVNIHYKDEYGETCPCILQTKQALEITNTLNTERKKYYVENNIPLKMDAEKTAGLNDLEKLAELKDKGVITAEEFEAKKKNY